jgi:hypothetical protein
VFNTDAIRLCSMSDKTEFVGGYVSKKLKRELEKIAQAEDRSVNWVLEKILTEGVKHRTQPADSKTVTAN